MSKPIVFVTGNAKKLEEFVNILGNKLPFKFINKSVDLPEIQGELDDICKMKCQEAIKIVKGPVVVEDTSLCFDALGGLPGPYIKWFLSKIGVIGLYKLLTAWENKNASAVCTIAYSDGGPCDEIVLFQGIVSGKIVEPRGSKDFGWDPCFMPDGLNKTFGELSAEEKNSISHRKLAVDQFRDYLLNRCS